MARHGLILGLHGAMACMDLLDAYLAGYQPNLNRFWIEMLVLPVPGPPYICICPIILCLGSRAGVMNV